MLFKTLLIGLLATTPVSATDPDLSLYRYAKDTWRSMSAMVEPATGLPADKVTGDLRTRAKVTSPTNVATYVWSTLTARDLGLINAGDAAGRVGRVLAALEKMERHAPTGQYYNWYDPATLALVRVWPESGDPVRLFASSVDNGWLATALMMLPKAMPQHAAKATRLARSMNFASYYDPAARPDAGTGLIRGGFWPEKPEGCSVETDYPGTGTIVYSTCHHYGAPAETRIATYVGIALGQIPREHYFGIYRTFPDAGCDWAWQDQKPAGSWKEYLGVKVWEGTYGYRGMRYVPNWGGSMFEALMPDLVVPEAAWAPRSWGRNHPVFVQGQIQHGLDEAKYGYWGFSPANDPHGGYREYGVDPLGMDAPGYTSDRERTQTDPGYEGCRPAQPEPAAFGDGVVTPHASFLALPYAKKQAMANLAKLKRDFDAYGPGGFYDSVAVRSGTVSRWYLALDQGMVMAALGNLLARGNMHRYFGTPAVEARLRPVMGLESWDVVPPATTR
ncbi:glucoamylase family protein [Nonomuraea typhae]|uniref:glucoamylase family protein n=1 Tax=Nonomuraea typhae TaxID=2603600 RepID=UPI0012F78A23|nr:glucoamylase family protein [Nonomuraea typhae]